jgi:hypothetical protein
MTRLIHDVIFVMDSMWCDVMWCDEIHMIDDEEFTLINPHTHKLVNS